MTTSNLPSSFSLADNVDAFLDELEPQQSIFIGFSGGLDSTVLLHSLNQQIQNRQLKNRLIAIHINHGLQQDSDAWTQLCADFCDELGIEFESINVDVRQVQRQGVESVARQKRYQAFFNVLQSTTDGVLVTAHHQRDQAETVFLNLMRGAGVNGLAAMQFKSELSSAKWLEDDCISSARSYHHFRPFLHVPYPELVSYAKEQSLSYIDDPSNLDISLRRNFVRHKIFPGLRELWPSLDKGLSSTAIHMQEAVGLLDEYAQAVLDSTSHAADFIEIPQASAAQQKNLIRFWLKQFWPDLTLAQKHYSWILEALNDFSTSENKQFKYLLQRGELRVYQRRLYFLNKPLKPFSIDCSSSEQMLKSIKGVEGDSGISFSFKINGFDVESKVKLTAVSELKGVDKKRLKRFFQSAGIPVWQRQVWPALQWNDSGKELVLGCENCTGYSLGGGFLEVKLNYSQLLNLWQN